MSRYRLDEVASVQLHLVFCTVLFYLLVYVLLPPFCHWIAYLVLALNPAYWTVRLLSPYLHCSYSQIAHFPNQRSVCKSFALVWNETFFIKFNVGLIACNRFELLGIFLEFGRRHFGFLLFDYRLWRGRLITGFEIHGPNFGFEFRDFGLYCIHLLLFVLEFEPGFKGKFFLSKFFLFEYGNFFCIIFMEFKVKFNLILELIVSIDGDLRIK